MGLAAAVKDYTDSVFSQSVIAPNHSRAFRIETPDGFVIVDAAARVSPGDVIAYQTFGYPMMGKWYPTSLITEEGEAIEGDALDDVIVLGKVMHEEVEVYERDGSPI